MKSIKGNISSYSIVFWVITISMILMGWYFYDWELWITLIVPFNFVGQIVLRKTTKYMLKENDLLVKVFYDTTSIEYEKIKSYSYKENGLFKQLLLGFPRKTIVIKYNKFDDLELFTLDGSIIEKLPVNT